MADKKKIHALQKQSEKAEEKICKADDDTYTDMIVYLRASNLTMYQQEQVRRDLLEITLSGEQRGESIEEIFGGDYQGVCDEIIANFPPVTLRDKVINIVSMCLMGITITLLATAGTQIVTNLIQHKNPLLYQFEVSSILLFATTIGAAYGIVMYICKTALKAKAKPQHKVRLFFLRWLVLFLIFGGILLLSVYLKITLFTCNVFIIIAAAAICYLLHRVLDNRTEY